MWSVDTNEKALATDFTKKYF